MNSKISQLFFKYGIFLPATKLLGQPYGMASRLLKKSQWWSEGELKEYQYSKLGVLLSENRLSIPHYGEVVSQRVLADLRNGDLSGIPVIEKHDIRDNAAMFCNKQRRRTTLKTTGGSTGQPVTVYKSRYAMGWELAGTWRSYGWAGIDVGSRQMRFWGSRASTGSIGLESIRDFLLNRKRCSAFAFSDEKLVHYVEQMRKFRPAYLYGYASMLATFAEFLISRGLSAPKSIKCVISTSEVLSPYQREKIEVAFSCKVYNEYGCGEVGSIAHECEYGYLHVVSENLIVEVMNGDLQCADGETGDIVVTELNNEHMPLVRYKVGDRAALVGGECECGRSLPRLSKLDGRTYDMVVNSKSQVFHGEYFMYIVEDMKTDGVAIRGIQVVQRTVRLLKIIVECAESDILDVKSRLEHALSPNFEISVTRVDCIDREKSGKMRLVVGDRDLIEDTLIRGMSS